MHKFEEILKKSEDQLVYVNEFERNSNTEVIYALASYADEPDKRSQIIEFIQKAFDLLKENAKKNSDLVNDIIFGAVGRLTGMIGERSLAPLIYNEFQFAAGDEQHYELNLEAGTLAIALSLLDYDGDTKAFDEFLTSYEYRYSGEEFVMEVRYAYWMIKKDTSEPVEYLKNPINVVKNYFENIKVDDDYIKKYGDNYKKNLGLVSAVLADLDAKYSLPVLKEILLNIKNPITQEVFNEVITRLQNQVGPPVPENRIIHLFGRYSSTELVLGQNVDNQFVLRARDNKGNNKLGNITESDESSHPDM